MTSYDDAVAELYRAEPSEFIAERTRLVGRLREQGDRDAAEELSTRRKPTLAAWAVNQVAHEHGEQLERLVELGDELTDADADAQALRDANRELRELLGRLRHHAAEALDELGTDPDNHLDEVEQTFAAAAVADDDRDVVISGELARPLPAPGFSAIAGMSPSPSQDGPPSGADRRHRRQRQRQIRELERHVESLERQRAAEEQRAERLRSRLRDTEASVAAHRERLERARDELADVRAGLDEGAG